MQKERVRKSETPDVSVKLSIGSLGVSVYGSNRRQLISNVPIACVGKVHAFAYSFIRKVLAAIVHVENIQANCWRAQRSVRARDFRS